MAKWPNKFSKLLTKAVRLISVGEDKTIGLVQDELGYALGREGGTAIEYWRKRHIPADLSDIETLARELVQRGGLINRAELEQFLRAAGYTELAQRCDELFPHAEAAPASWPKSEKTRRVSNRGGEPKRKLAPFVVGLPIIHPRQFFGREYELKRIFGLLRRFPLQNVALIGSARSGKTSLLCHLKQITTTPPAQLRPKQRNDWLPLPTNYRWVFVDFRHPRMRTRQGLLHHILTKLDMPVCDTHELSSFLDLVSHHLRTPAVILMDDIGAGLASPELDQPFWWSLRSLGSTLTNGHLAFILTSTALPSKLAQEHGKPSPFFNIFGHTLPLGPLTEREARELLASSPSPFHPADVEWILANSGRWPCLLQILCHTRLTALSDGASNDAWKEEGERQIEPFRHLLDSPAG